MLICEFDTPVWWNGEDLQGAGAGVPSEGSFFQFQRMVCYNDGQDLPPYVSTSTISGFYINKTINYGDIILLALILPVLFIILASSIRKMILHKFLN